MADFFPSDTGTARISLAGKIMLAARQRQVAAQSRQDELAQAAAKIALGDRDNTSRENIARMDNAGALQRTGVTAGASGRNNTQDDYTKAVQAWGPNSPQAQAVLRSLQSIGGQQPDMSGGNPRPSAGLGIPAATVDNPSDFSAPPPQVAQPHMNFIDAERNRTIGGLTPAESGFSPAGQDAVVGQPQGGGQSPQMPTAISTHGIPQDPILGQMYDDYQTAKKNGAPPAVLTEMNAKIGNYEQSSAAGRLSDMQSRYIPINFNETETHNRNTENLTARGQDVTQRGQDYGFLESPVAQGVTQRGQDITANTAANAQTNENLRSNNRIAAGGHGTAVAEINSLRASRDNSARLVAEMRRENEAAARDVAKWDGLYKAKRDEHGNDISDNQAALGAIYSQAANARSEWNNTHQQIIDEESRRQDYQARYDAALVAGGQHSGRPEANALPGFAPNGQGATPNYSVDQLLAKWNQRHKK